MKSLRAALVTLFSSAVLLSASHAHAQISDPPNTGGTSMRPATEVVGNVAAPWRSITFLLRSGAWSFNPASPVVTWSGRAPMASRAAYTRRVVR